MPIQLEAFSLVPPPPPGMTIVRTSDAFDEMMRFLEASPAFAYDTETSGLAWWAHARACGCSFAAREGDRIRSFYVPFAHHTGEQQLELRAIRDRIKVLLANDQRLKIGHHLKFDEHISRKEGWNIGDNRYDTMLAARLYDENKYAALKTRAALDLGHTNAHENEMQLDQEVKRIAKLNKIGIEAYKAKCGYSEVSINLCGVYACHDALYTLELYEFYERWGVSRNYSRIWKTEMALTKVLCDMEEYGMPVDRQYLETLRDSTGGIMASLTDQAKHLLGPDAFNLGSDDELRYFLMDKLKLPLWRRTKKKQISVERDVLEEFAVSDPSGIIKLIMKWRDVEKIHSTYTTSILEKLDANDILHGSFNQVGTNTGRMSSSDPNLQNFSTDDDDRALEMTGKKIKDGGKDPWSVRRAFVVRGPRVPRIIIDYSQIELRVLAYYSGDPIMREVYRQGGDIHKRTAEEVGVDRRTAKVINFGLSYCLTAQGLARQVKMDVKDAEQFMARFFQRYHGIASFREYFWSKVRSQGGQFSNLFGRVRHVPEILSFQNWERSRAERQAIGTLIQGTAAELTKESLVRIHRWLKAEKIPAQLVSTVHDELWIDTDVSRFADVAMGAKRLMEDFPDFDPVPITVSGFYTTTNWAEKKEAF